MPAPEGRPWDRLVLIDRRPVTVQVKTTTRPGPTGLYAWNVTCGYRRAPRGRRPYKHQAYMVLACVVLPERAVLFMPPGPTRVTLHPRALPGLRRDPLASLDETLDRLDLDPPADPSEAASAAVGPSDMPAPLP
jgi:hypothetical protein